MLLHPLPKLMLTISLMNPLATAFGGQTPDKPPQTQDFLLVFQQGIKAGKTPVGTKVQAKLWMATLVNGKVIPRNATVAGEVVESMAKNGGEPSRLSILLNSMTWKGGSVEIKAYLTSWYYPTLAESGPDLRYGPGESATRNWNGAGEYPNPNSPSYKPFPEADTGKDPGVPDTSNSVTSKNRVAMKDVEIQRDSGDRIVLSSSHKNISLDRLTVYNAVSGELLISPKPSSSPVEPSKPTGNPFQ